MIVVLLCSRRGRTHATYTPFFTSFLVIFLCSSGDKLHTIVYCNIPHLAFCRPNLSIRFSYGNGQTTPQTGQDAGDVHEAKLAALHGRLQGFEATYIGTQYHVIELPTLEDWREDGDESTILLPPQPKADIERPEDTESENAIQPNDQHWVEDEQPDEEDRNESRTPEPARVQLPFPWSDTRKNLLIGHRYFNVTRIGSRNHESHRCAQDKQALSDQAMVQLQ